MAAFFLLGRGHPGQAPSPHDSQMAGETPAIRMAGKMPAVPDTPLHYRFSFNTKFWNGFSSI